MFVLFLLYLFSFFCVIGLALFQNTNSTPLATVLYIINATFHETINAGIKTNMCFSGMSVD